MTNTLKRTESNYCSDDQRWAAVVNRDRNADGQFFYSVATTGVYCRPSCGSRQPLRKNVAFYTRREEAEAVGFRACKRCRPDDPDAQDKRATAMEKACRLIEAAEATPDFDSIAKQVGFSRFHFQRVFKEVTGVTPRSYFAQCRMRKVQTEVVRSPTITQAIYDSGFNSNGRFYSASSQMLGMTPKRYRAGGDLSSIRFALAECSLGSILVAATEKGICSILLGGDPDELLNDLQKRFPKASLVGADSQFEQMIATVIGFVEDPKRGLNLSLDVQGTAFQQRVWQALQEIPAGKTATYEEIARRIGSPAATRAVANACGSNPVAVAIPCHRVVRKDGDLSGYRWGIERKRALLSRESGNSRSEAQA
jgi:AraC family transcriptional regulator, regulatory protein of adaptative response / methylated-DNA-[protein]-cysteine methyltransferase